MGQKFCKKVKGGGTRKDDKRAYGTLPAMAATIVEEFVFKVDFIGSALLAKEGTGLSVIQKPLKEIYLENVKKAGTNPKAQERQLKIRPEGMLMTFRDGTGQTRHAFYDLASIHYFEAVKFKAVRASDKKIRGMFEPLAHETKLRTEVLPIALEKKQAHLIDRDHPPLFVCVIRRHSSVKALDCFVFIAKNENEALQMASLMSRNKYKPRIASNDQETKRNDSVSSAYRPTDYTSSPHQISTSHSGSHASSQSKYDVRNEHLRPRSTDFDHINVKDDGYLYPYPNNNDPNVSNQEVPRRYNANNHDAFNNADRSQLSRRPISFDEYNQRKNEENVRPRFMSDDSPTYRHFEETDERHHKQVYKENSIAEYRPFPADAGPQRHPARDKTDDKFGAPVCSMSNLESRQEMEKSHHNLEKTASIEESAKSRPVAKVPPHLVAGVKVLPTEFKISPKKTTPEQSPRPDKMAPSRDEPAVHTSQEYQDNIRYHVIEESKDHMSDSQSKRHKWREPERHSTGREREPHERHSWERGGLHNVGSHSVGKNYMSNHDQEFAAYAAKHEMVHNPYNVPDPSRDQRHKTDVPRQPLQTSYSANPTYSGEQWTVHDNSPHQQKRNVEQIGFSYLALNDSSRRDPQQSSDRMHNAPQDWGHHHGAHRLAPRSANPGGHEFEIRDRDTFETHSPQPPRGHSGAMEQSLGYLP